MAHKKGVGSSRNGRDSNPQYLGTKRFDGQLMLALHQPNNFNARIRLFEIEDTGETLRIVKPF